MNNKRIHELLKIIKSRASRKVLKVLNQDHIDDYAMKGYACRVEPIYGEEEIIDPLYAAVQYLLEENIKRNARQYCQTQEGKKECIK